MVAPQESERPTVHHSIKIFAIAAMSICLFACNGGSQSSTGDATDTMATPSAGEETKGLIDEAIEGASNLGDDVVDEAKAMAEDAKDEVEGAIADVKDQAKDVVDDALGDIDTESAQDELKDALQGALEDEENPLKKALKE
jgi:gas vesicle protein